MLNQMITKYQRWKAIQNTASELSTLSNRTLEDLGISRDQIHNIAKRAVFKKRGI